MISTHHAFAYTYYMFQLIEIITFYNHPSFYLLYIPTLGTVNTLEVRCTDAV
jgi:hypothetical protein